MNDFVTDLQANAQAHGTDGVLSDLVANMAQGPHISVIKINEHGSATVKLPVACTRRVGFQSGTNATKQSVNFSNDANRNTQGLVLWMDPKFYNGSVEFDKAQEALNDFAFDVKSAIEQKHNLPLHFAIVHNKGFGTEKTSPAAIMLATDSDHEQVLIETVRNDFVHMFNKHFEVTGNVKAWAQDHSAAHVKNGQKDR